MKKLITLILISYCFQSDAQTFYNYDTLANMNKLNLSKIYLEKLSEVTKLLPMMAFTIKQEGESDTYDGVLEVPETGDTRRALDRVIIECDNNANTSRDNLKVIIPYADKAKIIESILRFEGIIDMMKTVKL